MAAALGVASGLGGAGQRRTGGSADVTARPSPPAATPVPSLGRRGVSAAAQDVRAALIYAQPMDLQFSGEVWYWRGPAPWHFVIIPPEHVDEVAESARRHSYGWGCLPVSARVGDTDFTTALIPKDGSYLVPLKADVRRRERLEVGDPVTVRLMI